MTTLNLTGALDRLVADISCKMEEFSHIDPSRVLICLSSTRSGGVHGVYAKIHPMRFEGGNQTCRIKRGRKTYSCSMPTIEQRGADILYVIYFLFPRFFDLSFKEKMITVFHELYHISPEFNGDIRRFPGKNFAHGGSGKKYNAAMASLSERYLASLPDDSIVDFLKDDLETLRTRHRALVGRKMRAPRIKISA